MFCSDFICCLSLKSLHKFIPLTIIILMISPYVNLSYGICPLNCSLILILIFFEFFFGNTHMNFSFQKDRLQYDLNMTLVRNISLYHLKYWSFGHLMLINRSFVVSLILDGSPMKCLEMKKNYSSHCILYIFPSSSLTISLSSFIL